MNSPSTPEATQGPQDITALLTACESLWSVEARMPNPEGLLQPWRALSGHKPFQDAMHTANRLSDHLKTVAHQFQVRLVRDSPRQYVTVHPS